MHTNAVNTVNAKVQKCIDLYKNLMNEVTEMEHYYFASGVSTVADETVVGEGSGVTFAEIKAAIISLSAIRDLGVANGRAHLTNLYKTR